MNYAKTPWSDTNKGKDYTFQRQFNEKLSSIPGCPSVLNNLSLRVETPSSENLSLMVM